MQYESLLTQIFSPDFFPKERDLQLEDHALKDDIYALRWEELLGQEISMQS